jgi:hypothetical protein
MTSRLTLSLALVAVLGVSIARDARADDRAQATFALIIGSNLSVDPDLPPLKYADDDAADYLDLFRLLGARTYLLTRLDDNTQRLHPQAAAEALEPRRAALEQAVTQLAFDVAQARARAVDTVVYVVYAGHGNVADDEGYVTLEDARITGADLARLIARLPATQVHVIVDACASYYIAYSRGPGGERRPLSGFQDSALLAADPRVGLLLSTSSALESHEWEGFQAGVFSHEVRSGLYGAADADGDGRVSYREIAAFVSRANAAIPNERFRPNVHARPPRQSDTLLDLRRGLERRLEIDPAHAAHYFLEDSRGVRLLDVHNSGQQSVHILRPAPNGPVYVRREDDDAEFVLPLSPQVVSLADLEPGSPRVATRGAAHEAYRLAFSLPFDRAVVDTYVQPSEGVSASPEPPPDTAAPWKRAIGWSAVGFGATGVGLGVALEALALGTARNAPPGESQAATSQRNARIGSLNTGAAVGCVAGGASLATGLVVLLWPDSHLRLTASPTVATVGYSGSF